MAVDIALPSENLSHSKNLYVKTGVENLKVEQRRAAAEAPSFEDEHNKSYVDISKTIVDDNVPSSVRIDREKRVRVVVLSTPCENNFTQKNLREWSLNFSRPTVVRNAFTPPDLSKESYFLPESTKLHANVGQVGHFQDGNGSYTWQELWKLMKEGRNVYGSYGTGTSNGGVDLGTDCMNNSVYAKSILALKDQYLPDGMFKNNEYPGKFK